MQMPPGGCHNFPYRGELTDRAPPPLPSALACYSEERIACGLGGWFGQIVPISASVPVLLPVRPGCCLKANCTDRTLPPRSTPACGALAWLPAGGAASREVPAARPSSAGGRGVTAGESAACRAAAQRAQMMTHPLDRGLCQKQWGPGVTAQWKTKCFCLPSQGSHLLSSDSPGRLQAVS